MDETAHIGGKLQSAIVDESYVLDLGFQVLLPSYPELKRLDLGESSVDLKFFASGARLETSDKSILMGDPLRHPGHIFSTAFGPYGSFRDKLLVLKLQRLAFSQPPEALLKKSKVPTLQFLRDFGFSERIIKSFWKPFFAGIFLENDLKTSAGFFLYLVRMFAGSPVAVPAKGIGEFPRFLASKLKRTEFLLSTTATVQSSKQVKLSNGRTLDAKAVIQETGGHTRSADKKPFGQVTTLWFSADEAPYEGAWLSLVSRPGSPINHVAVMSNVSRDYAAKGDALVCVNSIEKAATESVLSSAREIYGSSVKTWSLLRRDEIDRAFPLYLDRTDSDTPSQQGALARGRKAALEILSKL